MLIFLGFVVVWLGYVYVACAWQVQTCTHPYTHRAEEGTKVSNSNFVHFIPSRQAFTLNLEPH